MVTEIPQNYQTITMVTELSNIALLSQVQSESPDLGAVVNTVLDKVARQNEDRDSHVLSILQDKDKEIMSLRDEVLGHSS